MEKIIDKIWLVFIFITTVFMSSVTGQTKVQVLTKTLEGQKKWTPAMKLEINGENAVIFCESYTGKSISFEIQIIAKHADKEKAELDLEKVKWISGIQGKTIFMRNYIELASGDARPESMLKVIYHIKIPENCPLTINNYFGEITVENTKGALNINSEFATITLGNVKGNLEVESKFGDISGKLLDGKIEIKSTRSDIYLEQVAGEIIIDASVTKINLEHFTKLESLTIKAEKSEIMLESGNKFRYFLDLDNTDFKKPNWMIFDPHEKKASIRKVNFIEHPNKPLIHIKQMIGILEIK